jgi:hypothetical protein
MMRSWAIVLALVAACGDDRVVLESIDAVSGSRIKLERWLYEDGTTHVDASGFYDVRLSTRCTARTWSDDMLRCVPVAGEALYTDADCTMLIGVAALVTPDPEHVSDTNVSHFIGYDWIDGEPRPTRLYTAGDPTTAPATYYSRRDGMCEGPFSAPGAEFYEIASELAPTVMPVLEEVELGAGRLGLSVLTTTDGLSIPLGLRDRALDVGCRPAAHGDGVVCEPFDVGFLEAWYADAECTAPVILVFGDDPAPSLVRTTDAAGCSAYAEPGPEISTPLYYASTGGCVRSDPGTGWRRLTLGSPVELPSLELEIADAGSRRLAPLTLTDASDPALRFTGERLLDRAIRAECVREQTGDVARCIPAATVSAFTLYESGCAIPVEVAEVPARSCGGALAFARKPMFDVPPTWHAIGEPVRRQLHSNNGSCSVYVPAAGRELHVIGPALPDDTFVRALKYGER